MLAVVIVLVSSCKSAQKGSGTTAAPLDDPLPHEKSLLWQVSGNGLEKPSYLFGTIHIIGADDFFLGENARKKLRNAEVLVMEMDIKNINPMAIAAKALLPDNKTIEDYLEPEDYQTLLVFFRDSIGVNETLFKAAYSRMKPFFLQQMTMLKFMGGETESYEMYLSGMAEELEIKMAGLETLEEQLAVLDVMSLDEQIEGMVQMIRNYSDQSFNFEELLQAYKAQDINKLYELIQNSEEVKDITNTLLDERNQKWIPKLEVFFKEGSSFVAVGAGHLAGPEGVISLLRNAGYTVVPISMD
jgi:uncharacterized protein YbaP (TraB family)